jgi:hypothetical protein
VLRHMIKLCTCSIYTGMLKMLCASLVVFSFYEHVVRLKVFLDSSGLSQKLKMSADWKPYLHERMPFWWSGNWSHLDVSTVLPAYLSPCSNANAAVSLLVILLQMMWMEFFNLWECAYSAFSSSDKKGLRQMIRLCIYSICIGDLKISCSSSGLSKQLKMATYWKP